MGIKQASRPAGVLNRLDVVFQPSMAPGKRQQVLSELGQEFLHLLFKEMQLTSVIVREQNDQGETLDQVIVNLGGPGQAASPLQAMPMGKGD